MKECIYREEATEFIDKCLNHEEKLQSVERETLIAVKKYLDSIPAADVKPVKHGEWIGYPECLKYPNAYADDHIVCSVCEECFSILDNCAERFDFCPHCGADMRCNDETT